MALPGPLAIFLKYEKITLRREKDISEECSKTKKRLV
jgi:hypothetical protein